MFAKASSEIDYSQFKKFFFPKLMQIEARAEHAILRQEDQALEHFNTIQNR